MLNTFVCVNTAGFCLLIALYVAKYPLRSSVSCAVSECCPLFLIAFLFSALFDAASGLLKDLPGVSNLVSEGVLPPIPSHVRKFIYIVRFFKIIHLRAFDESLAY